jgi:hypothetical protein
MIDISGKLQSWPRIFFPKDKRQAVLIKVFQFRILHAIMTLSVGS